MDKWKAELSNDPDRDFILAGFRSGFHIVDPGIHPYECEMENYRSATNDLVRNKIEEQIISEIEEGAYVTCNTKPQMVSALGAIPKDNGKFRLIHDCSRPTGQAVNDLIQVEKFSFQSLDDAFKMIQQGCFMGKVDLKNAYRTVPISQESQRVTGLTWHFDGKKTYLKDTRLPFGARASPYIFNTITQSIRRMMARRGYPNMVVYLDDFFFTSDSFEECQEIMNTLISLLRDLGFHINWSKVEGPTQNLTFLGIGINSVDMTCSIPSTKLEEIRQDLAKFSGRKRASKVQLQSLVGRLSWVARVIPAGRVYLRSLILGYSSLMSPRHKVRISTEMRNDLAWWATLAPVLNGRMRIKDSRPIQNVTTDACVAGGGGHFGGDWFYIDWKADCPELSDCHINYKEALCVVLAARRWAPWWANHRVFIYTDSLAAKGMLCKAKSNHQLVTRALKELFHLSAIFNFEIVPKYIPGKQNILADRLSRLHMPKLAIECLNLFPSLFHKPFILGKEWLNHMSELSYNSLYLQGCPLISGCKNSTNGSGISGLRSTQRLPKLHIDAI